MSKTWLKLVSSVAILGIILLNIDIEKALRILSSANLTLLSVTIIFNVVGVWFSVAKWRLLLDELGSPYSTATLHRLYYIGFFFNNFLPSMVGGDYFRVVNTSAKSGGTVALSAVLAERATGLLAMLALTCLAGAINAARNVSVGQDWLENIVLVLLGSILLGIGLWSILAITGRTRQTDTILGRVFFRVGLVLSSLRLALRRPLVLSKIFSLSIAFHFLLVANGYLFARSIGLDLDVIALAIIFPVAMLVAMVPISFNGFGVKEGALIVLLGQVNVSAEHALAIALLSRLFIVIASIIGAAIFAVDKNFVIVPRSSKTHIEA